MMKYSLEWLKDKFDRGDTLKYIFFWGHGTDDHSVIGKYVLSQWYQAPFIVHGVEYKTTEHWMMAEKARLFQDTEISKKIISSDKPGEVKELGRQIRNFDQAIWDQHKYDIVKTGNIHKFSTNRRLKEYLLSTGNRVLVEASPTDPVWGNGLAQHANQIENPHTWKGLNLLGFSLMEVRDVLGA
ncbi:MAG: NADAR family protein [Cyclobacteriaceae bacterium]|jgi:ribA/ribD-fused uncharacterized protein